MAKRYVVFRAIKPISFLVPCENQPHVDAKLSSESVSGCFMSHLIIQVAATIVERKPADFSSLQQKRLRVFYQFLHSHQKLHSLLAIHDTVII